MRKLELEGAAPPPAPIKEARGTINTQNLQEVIEASSSAKMAVLGGQAQFETPEPLARLLMMQLPCRHPQIAFDPQVASGRLLEHFAHSTTKLGFEIDNRFRETSDYIRRVIGNCVKAWEALDDIYPDLRFDCQVSNPPFGLKWKVGEQNVDSTEHTWQKLMERTARGGYGYMIANAKTIERLGLHQHPLVYLYQRFPVGVFKKVEVEIGVVHWLKNEASQPRPNRETVIHTVADLQSILSYCGHFESGYDKVNDKLNRAALSRLHWFFDQSDPSPFYDEVEGGTAAEAFKQIQEVLDEERKQRPEYNFWLGPDGRLRAYLSTRLKMKRKLKPHEITRLCSVNNCHPLTLTTDRASRQIMAELIDDKVYTIAPDAKAAIEQALNECDRLACPLMPVTPFESVAYADEEDELYCHTADHGLAFTAGKRYQIDTGFYRFTQNFQRRKVHYNPESMLTYTMLHDCSLSGQDRYIEIVDDNNVKHRFMERPDQLSENDKSLLTHMGIQCHEETWLWDIFQQPKVRTVMETHGKLFEKNVKFFKTLEMAADFTYYPGQLTFLGRIGVKDAGICAGATGTGKTLFTLSIIQLKHARRALVIAPQGTVRSSEDEDDDDSESAMTAAQWVSEIRKYAPGRAVYEIFSLADYEAIKRANGGQLPEGAIYISYYEAMFQNGALETPSQSWDDDKLYQRYCEIMQFTPENRKKYGRLLKKATAEEEDKLGEARAKRKWCERLGMEVNGIRSVALPCLSTLISHEFDFVAVDEAHKAQNVNTNLTQMLIRMQPKYRWAFTATPIPDNITNLFALAGWVTTPNWYKGNVRSAAWPFARGELARFETNFRTEERDHTQEQLNDEANAGTNKKASKCVKKSPIISSPARLLKVLKPFMAYISKRDCNPNYVDAKVVDIRVPMGLEQSKLYGHFLDRAHIACGHPLIRARKQLAYLRNICADPAGFTHGGPSVSSNFNPKTVATLELIRDILRKGDQFVLISTRIGQTDTFDKLLREAGVKVSRIDSTTGAQNQSAQANEFKRGETQGMLMGMRCAAAWSFSTVPHEIITSLEYSPGPLEQAKGRIDRVNSKTDRTIYCILHQDSIEQIMFDTVATKDDMAQICLRGQRTPRNFKPVDMSEVMAETILKFNDTNQSMQDEQVLLKRWPEMLASFRGLA